jgi:hypothetical protein
MGIGRDEAAFYMGDDEQFDDGEDRFRYGPSFTGRTQHHEPQFQRLPFQGMDLRDIERRIRAHPFYKLSKQPIRENDMRVRGRVHGVNELAAALAQTILNFNKGTTTDPKAMKAAMKDRVLLLNCEIAGVQYAGSAGLVANLQLGDTLNLEREPGNRFDMNAVLVTEDGTKLGYVPKIHAAMVSRLLEANCDMIAQVTQINRQAEHIRGLVEVGLYLKVA